MKFIILLENNAPEFNWINLIWFDKQRIPQKTVNSSVRQKIHCVSFKKFPLEFDLAILPFLLSIHLLKASSKTSYFSIVTTLQHPRISRKRFLTWNILTTAFVCPTNNTILVNFTVFVSVPRALHLRIKSIFMPEHFRIRQHEKSVSQLEIISHEGCFNDTHAGFTGFFTVRVFTNKTDFIVWEASGGGVPHPKFSPYERIQHLISIYPKKKFGFHEF